MSESLKEEPSGWWKRYRKEILVVGLFAIVPLVLYIGLSRPNSHIAGFYLVAGGQGYLSIERTVSGYEVADFKWSFYYASATDWKLRTRGDGFRMVHEESAAATGSRAGTAVMYYFVSSKAHAGDFDLLVIDQETRSDKWYERLWQRFKNLRSGIPAATAPPLRSFLHRVDDDSAAAYMQMAGKEPIPAMPGNSPAPASATTLFTASANSGQLLGFARGLVQRHPEDLYLRVLLLDALVRSGEAKELQRRIEEWRADFARAEVSDPNALAMFRAAERKSKGLAANQRGLNAYGALLVTFANNATLEQRLAMLRGISVSEALSSPSGITNFSSAVMNFLTAQITTKVAGMYVWFDLLKGDVDGAIALALGRMRLGQLLGEYDSFLITKLIGISLRNLASTTLTTLAANAPLTLEECDKLGLEINRLSTFEISVDRENLFDYDMLAPVPMSLGVGGANFGEARARHQVAAAKFQLTRTIVAARRALIATGKLPDPATPGSLAPILPDGPPTDCFSPTSSPLKMMANTTSRTLIAYSVGPDGTDDHGRIEFDPTNGTNSTGDITAQLSERPLYPFPRAGVHADTTASLLAQFPAGLPPDVFADTRGRGLSVAQTTDSVVVYSFGPDTDEHEIAAPGPGVMGAGLPRAPIPGLTAGGVASGASWVHRPNIQYDPTNGTVSKGDLITTIAR
jgi:hypothetical protein